MTVIDFESAQELHVLFIDSPRILLILSSVPLDALQTLIESCEKRL